MYQTGDWIIYGSTGVCRVEEVTEPGSPSAPRCMNPKRCYYVLKPLYQSETIYIPTDNPKVFMRPIVTREEAERLIDLIPTMEAEAYHAGSMQELRVHYQSATKTHDCADLMELVMSIYAKKQDTELQKRKFWQVDEQYMRQAEEMLHGELSVALGIAKEEVPAYIAKRVDQGKQA